MSGSGSGFEEEEGCFSLFLPDVSERQRRWALLSRFKAFLTTAEDRETDLRSVLQWLTDTKESLQDSDQQKEDSNGVVSTEWIENMEELLEKLMLNFECCINKLHALCQNLLDTEIKKAKKKTAAQKSGVRRWWTEKNVDAKTMKHIKQMQPPSVDQILEDTSLATRNSSGLALMLNDIAKSLSCNNAMNMAFSFIQTGLKNLNQALQDRTKEAKSLQVTVEKMKGNDCRSGLAKLKIQMADGNMKITKLEEELQRMKEENKDLLFEIQQLQIPQVQKATVSAPQSVGQGEPVLKNQLGQRDQENEPAPREEQTAFSVDESSDEVPQHIEVADNVGNLEEHVEKNGPDLLQNFQTVVMDLIAVCSESQPENKDEQCQKLDSDPRVKLYYTLQNTIRHCFNGLINKVEETISEKTVETLLGEESPFSEKSIKKAPGDMLRPISEEIQKHDQTVTDAGNNLQAPFQQDQSAEMQENSHSLVSDEVKSINEMAKRQTCNRGVTLESLQEIDLTMAPRNKGSAQEEPLCRSPEVTVSNSDNVPLLSSQKKKTKITSAKQTVEVEPEPQSGYTFLQNPENITLQNDDPVHLVDVVERYAMDMEEEGETLLRTKMRGIKFVINVQSQRSNLRILHLAFVNKRISSKLYSLVKHCVINTLDSVKLRLVCLFNRYVARDALQRVRRTLDAQLRLARGMTNGKTIKDLYCFLQRIDHFQHAVISKWSDRQISIDQRRRRCIAQMIYLFQQIREDYGLHLAMPYPCQSYKSLPFLCVMPMSLNLSFIQGPTPVPPRSTHHPSPLSDLRYGHVLSRVDSQDQVEDAERGKTAGANHQMSLGRADLMKKN